MPLKKAVLPYVKNCSGLPAVNMFVVKEGIITAINTDGISALDAIEDIMKVKGRSVLVLGAGGAATARRHSILLCTATMTSILSDLAKESNATTFSCITRSLYTAIRRLFDDKLTKSL